VPGDDGYREYLKRSVFELNGTQWGEFSDDFLVDSDTPFKLQWIVYSSSFTNNGLMDLADYEALGLPRSRVNINASGEFVYQLGSSYHNAGEVVASQSMDNKLCVIELNRSSNNTVSALINGNVISTTVISDAIRFDKCFVFGGTRFTGIPFGLLGWVDDNLILNGPFDESSSDYQRNRAVASGTELVTNGYFLTPDNWSDESTGSGSVSIEGGCAILNGDDFSNRAEYRQQITGLTVGKSYKLIVDTETVGLSYLLLADSSTGGVNLSIVSTTDGFLSVGLNEIVFEAVSTTHWIVLREQGSLSQIKSVSIREWSGVILQNALPEDWMQIEKKRWWDYWLGVQNLFGPTSNGSVSWTYDGNGTYTKDSNAWGPLGENFGNASVPGTYQVGFNYSGSGLRLYTQNPAGGNQFLTVPNAGRVLWDYAVPKAGLWFDSNVAIGAEISNISFRRKLEIAS
jgi:hypothetical protein